GDVFPRAVADERARRESDIEKDPGKGVFKGEESEVLITRLSLGSGTSCFDPVAKAGAALGIGCPKREEERCQIDTGGGQAGVRALRQRLADGWKTGCEPRDHVVGQITHAREQEEERR